MKSERVFWNVIILSAMLAGIATSILVHHQAKSPIGNASTAIAPPIADTPPASNRDLPSSPDEVLDFETARQLLLAMVDRSKDADLISMKSELSRPAERGNGYNFRIGYAWEITLANRSWTLLAMHPDETGKINLNAGELRYYGDFAKDQDGKWIARMKERQLSFRGGRR